MIRYDQILSVKTRHGQAGKKIEFLYGHWFDLEVTNDDLNAAFETLVSPLVMIIVDHHGRPNKTGESSKTIIMTINDPDPDNNDDKADNTGESDPPIGPGCSVGSCILGSVRFNISISFITIIIISIDVSIRIVHFMMFSKTDQKIRRQKSQYGFKTIWACFWTTPSTHIKEKVP